VKSSQSRKYDEWKEKRWKHERKRKKLSFKSKKPTKGTKNEGKKEVSIGISWEERKKNSFRQCIEGRVDASVIIVIIIFFSLTR
jgi:hypothetical protein